MRRQGEENGGTNKKKTHFEEESWTEMKRATAARSDATLI